jgi:L-asparaginase
MKPILLIHGGAGSRTLSPVRREEVRLSLQRILTEVFPALARGGSALNAVKLAVSELEDDPLYNAGKGSKIQSDGRIRMSASIMDGHRRRFAGCVNVEGVKNPVRLAAQLLNQKDRVLAGRGARQKAREFGLAFASPFTQTQREKFAHQRGGKTGTVGAVARDSEGRLAAATSTGGRGFEFPERVSDSPTCAGNFATAHCAVSATGIGEQIVEFSVASTLCAWREAGQPLDKISRQMLRQAKRAGAEFGFIALDRRGNRVALTSTPQLIWAEATLDGFRFMQSLQ